MGLDRHFGSGYGLEPTRSQIGGPGRPVNKPELSIRVHFHRHLPTRLKWAGSQRVVQRVHL